MVIPDFNMHFDYVEGALFRKGTSKKVGTNLNGYLTTTLGKKRYLVHRIVWCMFHGRWPTAQLDHINGIRNDNRIENLRECTNTENNRAVGIKKNNTSGYKGVTFNKASGKFYAYIRVDYKRIHLGVWESPTDAAKAYNEAALKYFGEFATLNRL